MHVTHKEDIEAERAMRDGLRPPWGGSIPKVAIPSYPDLAYRVDGPFLLGFTRKPGDERIIITEAADTRTHADPRAYLRRRIELFLERGQHGETV
jgi:hypothetical protein